MNYAKSGKQNPRGEQGVTVKGGPDPILQIHFEAMEP